MTDEGGAPLDLLEAMAIQEVEVAPGLRHVEVFTRQGLLTLLWHGERSAEHVVVLGGGAMGGLLGPADALYHDLGEHLADAGIGTVRVGWRRPNDLAACVLDMASAIDLAARGGGRRFVTVGHSFGGAVAVNTAAELADAVVGVVTLATQAGGCEAAERLEVPLLLLHGERDQVLPPMASEMVRYLAGAGEVVVLPGCGHLMVEAAEELRTRLGAWIPAVLTGGAPPGAG